ncbi:helix-turn-helix transcriptional regulator [Aquihabitans sp. McL0605]|uniref:helix-turn-helix transcriptional regulator n=1 Tax=Aquihabitans sp. McL0605 TaxID=3415671 RepID=UPI003CEB89B8
MAVREGLLALLVEQPRHGYDLRSRFEAKTADLWRINSGQVYTTLDRLERDGLVDATDDPDDDSGRRRLYRVTDAGRQELRQWLDAASWSAEPHRDELLMKVLLVADRPAEALAIVTDHRRALLAQLQSVRRQQRRLPDDLRSQLAADAVVARLESDLHWLDRCEQRLTKHGST